MQPTYRVIETNKVGKLIPCPCDNPVILEFKDGIRDVFFLRELEPTASSISPSTGRGRKTQKKKKGSSKGLTAATIQKMLRIYQFLFAQDQPVYRAAIQKAVGFDITRSLMNQRSRSLHTITLESLGIVERLPGERTWCTWQLTELGRTEGDAIIRGLKLKRGDA